MSRKFEASKVKKKSLLKKILKWSGITFLLILITLIALPFIFKDKLVEIIKEEANNSVNATIDWGDFDLTLFSSFPNFSFDIQDVSIIGVNEFEGVNLATIKKTSITLDLMSVINGEKIKIKSVEIENPTINVIVNKDSLANYDIAIASESDTGVVEESSEAVEYEIGLKKLSIINANIIYDDSISNIYSNVKNLNFDLSGDFTQDNFDVASLTSIEELTVREGVVNYLNKTNLEFDAKINIDKFIKYTMKENSLKLNELELGLDGWVELLEDKMNLDIKFDSKKTSFKSILSLVPAVYVKDFSTIDTKGNLELNGNAKGSLEGDNYPSFNVDMGISDGYFKYPDMPNSADNINIKTKISHPQGDLDKLKIDVSKFHLELANNPIDATLKLTTPMSDPNIESMIKADIDLEKLKTVIPMEENEKLNGSIHADLFLAGRLSSITKEQYEDFRAEGDIIVKDMLYSSKDLPYDVKVNSMMMDFSPQFVDLKELNTKIGNSDLKAVGRIDNILPYIFNNEVLKGNVKLTSNKLDVDDLMRTVPADGEVTVENQTADTAYEVFRVPKFYDMNITIDIKELIYDGLSIKNVQGSIGMKDEIANLSNVKMDMLEGNVVLNGSYNSKNTNPKVDFDYDIKNVNIEQMATYFSSIETIAPVAKHCKGKISTNMKIATDLDKNMEPIYSSINGSGGLFSNNITVSGVKSLTKIAETLKIKKLATQSINKIQLAFELKEGRALVKPFNLTLSGIPSEIQGSTGFDQTIEYKVNMKVPKEKLGSKANDFFTGLIGNAKIGGQSIPIPANIPVNFIIGGTVTKPIIKTNFGGDTKDMIGSVKDKIVDTIKTTVNEKIDGGMKLAREQAQRLKEEAKVQADRLRAEGVKLTDKAKLKANEIADKAKLKADEEAEKIATKGSNFLEKAANKKAAEFGKKKAYQQIDKSKITAYKKAELTTSQAEDKAKLVEAEAEKNAQKILDIAQQKADKLKR